MHYEKFSLLKCAEVGPESIRDAQFCEANCAAASHLFIENQ